MKKAGEVGRLDGGRLVLFCLAVTLLTGAGIGGYWLYQQSQVAAFENADKEAARLLEARRVEIEAKKKEPVYITLPGATAITAPAENYEDPANLWTLVNKERALPPEYVPPELISPELAT